MRLARAVFVVGVVCLSGCTAGRLRQRTINQGASLPALQYQQVLDNLAQFAAQPDSLPWHVNLKEGTSQVTDSLSGGAAIDIGPPVAWFPQLLGSRTAVAQWGMAPVIDATELRLLRIAYRRADGAARHAIAPVPRRAVHELKNQFASNADLRNESELFFEYQSRAHRTFRDLESPCAHDQRRLSLPSADASVDRSPLAANVCQKIEMIQDDLAEIRPGWFHVGSKHDVPKDACYVGRCGTHFVWVGADGVDQLTEFTLTVLKISSLIKETETLISPGSVKFSPGDRGG